MKYISTLLTCLFFFIFCYGQDIPKKNYDAAGVQFVIDDIPNFWIAFDSCKIVPNNSVEIYNGLYFDKGSYGLKVFKKAVIGTTEEFVERIKKYNLYYESIRANTFKIASLVPAMRKSLVKLKELYPAVIYPDVYLVVGCMSSGGRSMKEGLFLGADVNCADSTSDFTNVNPPFAKILKSLTISNLPVFITHELVHYQQNYADTSKNVLSRAIVEGSADFICKLATGVTANELLHTYGEQHEQELWNAFKNDLYNKDVHQWFYYAATAERPADLGYYIGFKITQSYYMQSKNKKEAIAEILNTKDFKLFLEKSNYEKRFKSIKH